jgi:hypothetical protein
MFVRAETEVGGLDSQGGVVGDEAGGGMEALTKCRADDPVVRDLGVKTMLDEEVALDAVHLDVDAASFLPGVYLEGGVEDPAGAPAEIFECAQGGPSRAADVVESRLQAVQFLDHRERNNDFTPGKGGEACWVGDEDGGIENDTCSSACGHRIVGDHITPVAVQCVPSVGIVARVEHRHPFLFKCGDDDESNDVDQCECDEATRRP